MTRVRIAKTSFTAGEVAAELIGRADLRAYENGAARLRNVVVQPTGGVARRPGLRHVASLAGPGPGAVRLVAFEFNTEQVYLLAFGDARIDVFAEDMAIATIEAPWTAAQLGRIAWTQSADTLLVVHPDVAPMRLTRTGVATWSLAALPLAVPPFHRFAPAGVTLAASATAGTVTLTASAAVFEPGHAGAGFRIAGGRVAIDAVVSPTEASATVTAALAGTGPTVDWQEAAFSAARGWPVTAAFHQDRLVLGGSRDLPNRLWMSKAADLYDFSTGEGLDDEAIEFPILSDQVNAIRAVFSGRHLQVFTSGAEWMVTGEPLTPSSVQLRRQTRVGSPVGRTLRPVDVDGATLFVARGGAGLREFLFADVEQAYQAADLALLARHLFHDPVELDFDAARRLVCLVMGDGSLAALTIHRPEQVVGWSRFETEGAFRSVAAAGDVLYAAVERDGTVRLERFDDALGVDAGVADMAETPGAALSGLGHLEGREVVVLADGRLRPPRVVAGGEIPLDPPARSAAAGLPFEHRIEPLPPAMPGGAAAPTAWRLVQATFRLLRTASLRVDTGAGFRALPFRRIGGLDRFDGPVEPVTGDRRVAGFGWRRAHGDGTGPAWRIADATPLPMTLLSVTTELKVSD